jgi:DNA gyrase inhibitor GyrI
MTSETRERIELRQLKPAYTATISMVVAKDQVAEAVGGIFRDVFSYLTDTAVQPEQAFGRYTPMGQELHVCAGFTVPEPIVGTQLIKPGLLPGGEAVTCVHEGPYETVEEAYHRLGRWMSDQGRVPAAPPWEVYLSPPEEEPPRTEVVFVLERP